MNGARTAGFTAAVVAVAATPTQVVGVATAEPYGATRWRFA
ncbi:hypothetical protein [Dactylosporangium sp. NPDC048998]